MTGQTGGAGWDDLSRELDAWRAEGLTATFWWRDDDATMVTDASEKMFEISDQTGTPLALAIVPAHATRELRDRVARHEKARVLQHGFAHINHQPADSKKSEFGTARDTGQVMADLRQGRDLLSAWETLLPVFVPPWNRMEDRFLPLLPKLGFTGLSRFKARPSEFAKPGVFVVNSHIDIIKSGQGGRQFIGSGEALRAVIGHLSDRRLGRVDKDEPSGILTHHLDHDNDGWVFVEQLLSFVGNHPAARWLDAVEVFTPKTVRENL